jgi:exodeoxyribonuclease VII large subunit
MPTANIFTLSDITMRLADIIAPHEQKTFWVQAEVASAVLRGGNIYATLVEFAGGKQVAKLECAIWSRDLIRIQTLFRKADLHFDLAQGMKACLCCHLSFHPVFGLKLVAVDADPRFVLGELELRKREIIGRLVLDGSDKRNKILAVPALPLRLGLVTSRDSAAYNDLIKTLRDSGYGFTVLLADALMQGDKAEASLLRALDTLAALKPDLVIVARGGGNKTELASLDSEAVARRIAASAIPVWTAIGHEIDSGVLDLVAHTAHKTPTALAEAIVKRYTDAAHHTRSSRETLRREWTHRIDTQRNILTDDAIGIRQGSRKLREWYHSELLSQAERVHLAVTERFAAHDQRLAVAAGRLRLTSGYALRNAQQGTRTSTASLRETSATRCGQHLDTLQRAALRLRPDRIRPLLERARTDAARAAEALRRGMRTALLIRTQRARLLGQRLRGSGVPSRISHLLLLNEQLKRLVEAHDPVNTLKRGFARVTGADGRTATSIDAVRSGDDVRIQFHDGAAGATISTTEHSHG